MSAPLYSTDTHGNGLSHPAPAHNAYFLYIQEPERDNQEAIIDKASHKMIKCNNTKMADTVYECRKQYHFGEGFHEKNIQHAHGSHRRRGACGFGHAADGICGGKDHAGFGERRAEHTPGGADLQAAGIRSERQFLFGQQKRSDHREDQRHAQSACPGDVQDHRQEHVQR